MAPAMYASVLAADGRWTAVQICASGYCVGFIPGTFKSKAEADKNARRNLGL